jgi:hypothetical protein
MSATATVEIVALAPQKFVGVTARDADGRLSVLCRPGGHVAWFLSPATAAAKLGAAGRTFVPSPLVEPAQIEVALTRPDIKLLDADTVEEARRQVQATMAARSAEARRPAAPAEAPAPAAPVAPAPVAPVAAAPVPAPAAPRMAPSEVLDAVKLGLLTPAEGRAALGLPPLAAAAPVEAAPVVEATPVVAAPVVEAAPAVEVASSPLPEGDNVAF